MSSALAQLDAVVFNGIKDFPAVAALIPSARIQIFDRGVDIRGDVAGNPALGPRLQIERVRTTKQFDWSNTTARYERRYAVRIGTGTTQDCVGANIEWVIDAAVLNMFNKLNADGSPRVDPLPWEIETILAVASDPHRDLVFDEIEELRDVVDIVLVAYCNRSDVGR